MAGRKEIKTLRENLKECGVENIFAWIEEVFFQVNAFLKLPKLFTGSSYRAEN